ncbi:MAG: hypothetical protein K0R08_488 [Solimicrobium sp.]|jgi:putative transposase|nr:hypothetical protein [Solimicrobium sp.]
MHQYECAEIIKTKSSFAMDKAMVEVFYLALNNICQKWTMPIKFVKLHYTIQFGHPLLTY